MSDVTGPEFPSNSSRARRSEESEKSEIEPRKVTKVIVGGVTKKKKSFLKKVSETLFKNDDGTSIMEYIFWDVVIPMVKSTILDVVTTGLKMKFYGENKPSDRIYRDRDRSYFDYQGVSRDRDRDRARSLNRDRDRDRGRIVSSSDSMVVKSRARLDYNDIIFASRGDAESVLIELCEMIDKYGQTSIGDFYEAIGEPSAFTESKYGWDRENNLRNVRIVPVREGYSLILPEALELD